MASIALVIVGNTPTSIVAVAVVVAVVAMLQQAKTWVGGTDRALSHWIEESRTRNSNERRERTREEEKEECGDSGVLQKKTREPWPLFSAADAYF